MAEEKMVRVKPHPAAGATVVVADKEGNGVAYEAGSAMQRADFDALQKREAWHRPTHDYPEGFPYVVEDKEDS